MIQLYIYSGYLLKIISYHILFCVQLIVDFDTKYKFPKLDKKNDIKYNIYVLFILWVYIIFSLFLDYQITQNDGLYFMFLFFINGILYLLCDYKFHKEKKDENK